MGLRELQAIKGLSEHGDEGTSSYKKAEWTWGWGNMGLREFQAVKRLRELQAMKGLRELGAEGTSSYEKAETTWGWVNMGLKEQQAERTAGLENADGCWDCENRAEGS